MKRVVVLLGAVVPMLAAAAHAQAPRQASVTSVVVGDHVDLAEIVAVSMGLRRGTGDVEGLRYRHLGDVLGSAEQPSELFDVVQGLDSLADAIRGGHWRGVAARARAAIGFFEANLRFVKRANLIDAYMLAAIAACHQPGGRRRCAGGFERLITFRESLEYDITRYPEEYERAFEETKARLLADGLRGSIEVTTDPPGAEVFVDGRSYGPSPAVAEGLLVGDHYVTVKAPGYEERVERATVEDSYQASVEYVIEEAARNRLVEEKLPAALSELGQQRAGDAIRALGTVLPVSQLIIAVLAPVGRDRIHVRLYVYHNRTLFMIARQEATVSRGAAGVEEVRQLTVELYDGVDLSGQIEAPADLPLTEDGPPMWARWWFWTAVGVVLLSGVIAAYYLLGSEPVDVPQGWLRFNGNVR